MEVCTQKHTHSIFLLMSVLEGGLHYAAKGLAFGPNYCLCTCVPTAAVVLRDAGGVLDKVQNVTKAAGEG